MIQVGFFFFALIQHHYGPCSQQHTHFKVQPTDLKNNSSQTNNRLQYRLYPRETCSKSLQEQVGIKTHRPPACSQKQF